MKKIKLMFSTFVSMVLTLTLVSAYVGDGDCGMGGMMFGNYGLGGMFFGWIIGVLFAVILVLLIVWLIKQIQKNK